MGKNIWLEKKLLRSSAFRSLSKWSLLVYMNFLCKRQMDQIKTARRSDSWIIRNNGEIVYPYAEAENRGIARREFRNALDELIGKGFLDITHQGHGGRSGDMTRYLIDDRWVDFGKTSFRPAKNPRKKDSRKGRGWSAYHAKKKKSPVTKSLPKKNILSNRSVNPNKENKQLPNSTTVTPEKQIPVQLSLIFE